jgi:hypothetical protein
VKDSSFNGVDTATDKISNVDGVSFTNVKINGKSVSR